MDFPEKLAKQNKNTTQNVLDTTILRKQIQNVIKTLDSLKTGGKDEPNIVFMRKS